MPYRENIFVKGNYYHIMNRGNGERALGDANKAIDYYNKALEIFMAVYGLDHPHTRTVQANLDSLKAEIL